MSENALPDPPIPSHIDCRDLDSFMFNATHFLSSELVALHHQKIIGVSLLLWCHAWKQIPAASLPNNNRVLAGYAKMSVAAFVKVKDAALHGFELCNDGRLYHRFLVKDAVRAYERKLAYERRRETDKERLRKWRETHRETRFETRVIAPSETRFVAEDTVQYNTVHKEEVRRVEVVAPSVKRVSPTTGTRWGPNDHVPQDWIDAANDKRTELGLDDANLTVEAETFANYWSAKAGVAATKLDWRKTWINWSLKASGKGNGHGRKTTAHDNFIAGARRVIQRAQDREAGIVREEDDGDFDPVVETGNALLETRLHGKAV